MAAEVEMAARVYEVTLHVQSISPKAEVLRHASAQGDCREQRPLLRRRQFLAHIGHLPDELLKTIRRQVIIGDLLRQGQGHR